MISRTFSPRVSYLVVVVLALFMCRTAGAFDRIATGSGVPIGPTSGSLLELQSRPLAGATDFVRQDTTSAGMLDALNAYYDAEKSALPATEVTGAAVIVLGGVLESRKSRFAKGLGLPFLLFGGMTGIGSLIYGLQVDARHARYENLLDSAPELYREQELEHLEKMQTDFGRTISMDASMAAAGFGLAAYGAVRNNSLLKGVGIGALVSTAALTALEVHNRNRSTEYLHALQLFNAHTSLEMGENVKSWSLVFRASF
ncbi:hypothetical protein [Paraburkholderia heleia]|uniref:hypothetical protein n=1 Tax=Paraburkholderia heleia TaxID=634127 RepID=UPI0012EDF39A|nr:hypothetical protein [Paraburkholderia heleia]